MSINSALVSGDYTNLRKNSFYASQYICLWPNEIVFKSTLSAAFSGDSYAAVTFGSTIAGDSADVLAGMRVVIGPNDDIDDAIERARSNNGAFDGRTRAVVSGSTLPINETSATLASGAYVWVIRDYPVADKLARESGGVYYKDWDKTFAQLPPIIGNLQTAYAGICSGDPEVFTVSFAPTAIAGTDGASVSGWNWTIPAGGTITSGSSTTQNITVTFSAGTYDVILEVDDGPRTATRHIYVFAVPSDLSSVVSLGFEGAEISADVDSGYTARVNAFEDLSSTLDNTLCVIFDVSRYGGTEAIVVSNMRMVGRLSKEANRADMDATYNNLLSTDFDIVGAGGQLGRIASSLLTITDNASPAVWDEIDKATYWRVIAYLLQEHSTYLLTHSLQFDDTSDDYRLTVWGINGGDLLSEVNDTAGSIGASIEFAADGRTFINIRATQLSSADRSSLTTVANWTSQDFTSLAINRDLDQQTGLVTASGGTFLSATNSVQAYLSQAPGVAPEDAVGKRTMPGQALGTDLGKVASETELNRRTGNAFAEQNPKTELVATHPDGYGWLVPSRSQWYTWTLTAADTNLRGLAYTTSTRWLLTRITTRHNNASGTKSVEATYQREVAGSAGQTIEEPPPTEISDPIPGIPPIIGLPPLGWDPGDIFGDIPGTLPPFWNGDEVPMDGNAVVVPNKNGVWNTTNFKQLASTWHDVSPTLPSGYTIRDAKFGVSLEYYVLASDGTSSVVFYADNPFGANVTWTRGEYFFGAFTEIEPTGTRGLVYVKGLAEIDENDEWTVHWDFYGEGDTYDADWYGADYEGQPAISYNSDNTMGGICDTDGRSGFGGSGSEELRARPFHAFTLTSMSVVWVLKTTRWIGGTSVDGQVIIYAGGANKAVASIQTALTGGTVGPSGVSWTPAEPTYVTDLQLIAWAASTDQCGGECRIRSITISGIGPYPFSKYPEE